MSVLLTRRFWRMEPLTGLHVLIMAVGFFGIIIAANIAMALYAASSRTGLLAKNGYVASIDYAADERERDRATALGWTVRIYRRADIVHVDADGADGWPLDADAVSAVAAHPLADAAEARPLLLERIGEGRYAAREPLEVGSWIVKATLVKGDAHVVRRAKLAGE